MINLGRNDPCHCGSGKKYKKCHLDADQRSRAGIRQSQPGSESSFASATVQALPKLLRQLSEEGSATDRKEFGELLSKTEPILEYLERRGEIEAAAAKLEANRSEFERLAADEGRYLEIFECGEKPVAALVARARTGRKDHNAGGQSGWMQGFFDRPGAPLWQAVQQSNARA